MDKRLDCFRKNGQLYEFWNLAFGFLDDNLKDKYFSHFAVRDVGLIDSSLVITNLTCKILAYSPELDDSLNYQGLRLLAACRFLMRNSQRATLITADDRDVLVELIYSAMHSYGGDHRPFTRGHKKAVAHITATTCIKRAIDFDVVGLFKSLLTLNVMHCDLDVRVFKMRKLMENKYRRARNLVSQKMCDLLVAALNEEYEKVGSKCLPAESNYG